MLFTSAHINDPMKIWITDWGLVCLIWPCNLLLNLLFLSSSQRSLKYIYAFPKLWEANCLKGYIYTLVFPKKHIHPTANCPYVHTCPKSPQVCLVLSGVIMVFVLISVCMKKCKGYIKPLLGQFFCGMILHVLLWHSSVAFFGKSHLGFHKTLQGMERLVVSHLCCL